MKVHTFMICLVLAGVACGSAADAVSPQPDCTLEARAGIALSVVDSLSGGAVATGVTVLAQDGSYMERPIQVPDVPPRYFMAYERPGTYRVTVTAPAFQPWQQIVTVVGGRCHVNTLTVVARLVR